MCVIFEVEWHIHDDFLQGFLEIPVNKTSGNYEQLGFLEVIHSGCNKAMNVWPEKEWVWRDGRVEPQEFKWKGVTIEVREEYTTEILGRRNAESLFWSFTCHSLLK